MKKKYWILVGLLIFLMVIMAGCDGTNVPITSESKGIWNHYFVYPLSWVITKVASLPLLNYGLSIIIVTIVIRLILLPLMIKQTKSSKAMQAIQPELKKLQEKYSSKDQATQAKLQQETMALFQANGVNPFAGCLPLLIQMPILIAFYHAISRTKEIATHSFLWFDLGNPDPIFLLPILAGVTTFLQQKIMMAGQEQTGAMAQQMKIMLYVMPVMIFVFALQFPAALSLYWVVGNIFMIIQTYFINGPRTKTVGEQKAGVKK